MASQGGGSTGALSLPRLIEVAAWVGALAGVAQVLVRFATEPFADQPSLLGPHQVWMAPLATSLLLMMFAVPLGLAALAVPVSWRHRVQIVGLAAPSCLSVALLFPRIDERASLLLCLGIGLQVSRLGAPVLDRIPGWSRRSLPVLAGLLAASGLLIAGWRVWEENRSLQYAAAPASKPNVLLIVVDTERAMSLGLYGGKRPTTPWLDRFSASGTVFDWAISAAPWTLPSHASMFTGRLPHELSAELKIPLDGAAPTLAERLSQAGYSTGGLVANTAYCARTFGLDRGFGYYEDLTITPQEIFINSTLGDRIAHAKKVRSLIGWYDIAARRTAPEVTGGLLRWLDRPRDRPFFAFVNLFDVHDPYLPPAPFDTAFGASNQRDLSRLSFGPRAALLWNFFRSDTPPEVVEGELRSYEASIAYVDRQLEGLFRALEARGILDQTLVIVTSDHGEAFGEQPGVFRHGTSLLMPEVHVPLLIRWPGVVAAGRRVPTPVSLRDLSATILDLVGIHESPLPGSSLGWAVRSPEAEGSRPPAISSLRKFGEQIYYSVTGGGYHYIRQTDRSTGATISEELYDLVTDPVTVHDLSGGPAASPILSQLRHALDSTLAKAPPLIRRPGV